MSDRKAVRLYMRVQNQTEICIGTAKTMSDVPILLESVAAMLRAGLEPDALESGIVRTHESYA
jgi:hypothetical protein